jgi:transposase
MRKRKAFLVIRIANECSNNLFEEIYKCCLRVYSQKKRIRWKYQSIDSTTIKAYRGGEDVGANSTDRGRNGSKIHTLCDKNGIPLTFIVTGANYHDSRSVPSLIQTYKIRRPRYQQHMNLDSAYDTRAIKNLLSQNMFYHHIPLNRRNSRVIVPRMTPEDKVHYKHRITVEHQFGHLKQFKGIIIRYARKVNHYVNMINIAYTSIICNKI